MLGGSSGIGSSIVDILFSKGCWIYNLDISEPLSSGVTKATYFRTDVSSWQPQLQAFKAVVAKHGHIDYVFANAGTNEGEMAFEDKVDDKGDPIEPRWSTVSINLIGVLTTVKLAMHFFRAQEPQGGSIVMTTSRSGTVLTQDLSLIFANTLRIHGLVHARIYGIQDWSKDKLRVSNLQS